jgi:hypothetical protein
VAKAMQKDGYRGPLAWAKKVIDFVADYTTPPAPAQEPVADTFIRQYVNALVANNPDEAAHATKAMVDYVYGITKGGA